MTIEITDPKEAHRCRIAQYRGHKATVILNGLPVTGMVRSVKEHKSSGMTRWTVTVVPKQSERVPASRPLPSGGLSKSF